MIPLSFAQRRLWFLSRLEGPSATYNVPLVVRLAGVPDPAALTAAVGDLLDRHEVLRTVVDVSGGEPAQRTLDAAAARAVADVRVVRCAPGEVDGLVRACAAETFDLTADLPLRVRLLVSGPDESVLVILAHHIATDGCLDRPAAGRPGRGVPGAAGGSGSVVRSAGGAVRGLHAVAAGAAGGGGRPRQPAQRPAGLLAGCPGRGAADARAARRPARARPSRRTGAPG